MKIQVIQIIIMLVFFSTTLHSQCQGIICENVCLDVELEFEFIPSEVCGGEELTLSYNIVGDGASTSFYTVRFSGVGTLPIVQTVFPNSSTTYEVSFTFLESCGILEHKISYEIVCITGEILEGGDIATLLVYPPAYFFEPTITPSQECGQAFELGSSICGSITSNLGNIIYPNCGISASSQTVNWTIDPGFELPSIDCYDPDLFFGSFEVPSCDLSPGDFCQHACLGQGVINEDCECEVNGLPEIIISEDISGSYCFLDFEPYFINISGALPPNGLELVIEQAGVISPRFVDNNTVFPIETFVSVIGFNNCTALINEEVIAYFRCPQTLAPISDPVLVGIVNLFPDDRLYNPISIEPGECGEIPSIELNCGELEVISFIPPSDDCDNLAVGEFVWRIDPGFDISEAPSCFNLAGGEFVLQPCSDSCPCGQGLVCGDTPIALVPNFDNIPENVCGDELIEAQVFLLGPGVSESMITVQIFDSEGDQITDLDLIQGTTAATLPIRLSNTTCDPIIETLEYRITCTGSTLLSEGILGSVTVYPPSSSYLPFIIEGIACGVDPFIESAPCGMLNVDPSVIPNPECGPNAQDQIIQWSVDIGIDIPEDISHCFDVDDFSGELIVPACDLSEGDDCFDICKGPGIIGPDCKCQFSNPPVLVPQRDITGNYCAAGSVGLDFDIVGHLPPNGLGIVVLDQNNNMVGSGNVGFFGGTSGSLNVEFFNNTCDIQVMELSYYFICGESQRGITSEIFPLATVQVYPFQFNYIANFFNYNSCADIPEIFSVCGDLVITNFVAPINGSNSVDGFIEYTIDPGIDLSDAPQCYFFDTTTDITGTFPLPACIGCGTHGRLIIRAVESGN